MKTLILLGTALACGGAAARESADYALAPETAGSGGSRAASADYTADHAIGPPGGAAAGTGVELRAGYAGQLFDAASLVVSADPATIDEGGSRQLAVAALLDDGSLLALAPGEVAWSVASGPLDGIDAAGLATAGLVWQETPATARAAWASAAGELVLTVLDTEPDNCGSYAGDGIDDWWQHDHFGADNPLAAPDMDPDGDRQDNLFEFTAGLDPTNPLSRFLLRIEPVPGQPLHKNLVFGPVVAGRSYGVLHSADPAAPAWLPLPGSPPTSDDGDQRTVTDTDATGSVKFYRIQVSRP